MRTPISQRIKEQQELARIARLKVFQEYENRWLWRLDELLWKKCGDFDTKMEISYSNIIYGRKDLDICENEFTNDRGLVQRDFFEYLAPILTQKFEMRVEAASTMLVFKWGKDQYKR
jgi:hypothetical protein